MTHTPGQIFLEQRRSAKPNGWDVIALMLIFAFVILLAWGAREMSGPFEVGKSIPISLDPINLPHYALQSTMRIAIALCFSFLFTFILGALAAKNKHAELLIIPMVDVLQSIPVLSFLSVTVTGFVVMFSGSMWGPQWASIFAVFTSQVWNMILSFYQSLITLPSDIEEAAKAFHLSSWQKFWKIEVPFAIPALLWNTMLSLSGSWFFVVASEAMTISNQKISLPGIGSYIALAIEQANEISIFYGIIAMFIVIFIYDQIVFRPLVQWSERFALDYRGKKRDRQPWFTTFLQKTRFVYYFFNLLILCYEKTTGLPALTRSNRITLPQLSNKVVIALISVWYLLLLLMTVGSLILLYQFIFTVIPIIEAIHVFFLGFITAVRVFILIVLSSLLWVPIGVWVGLRPKIARVIQPTVQFIAAFPANVLFPVVVLMILHFKLNVEVWTSPLMILGTQWYIFFNVIAGTMALPKELQQAAENYEVSGWLWWRKILLPSIFPYYITGAMSAAGGAWNASILAEVVSWGDTTLRATGLGAYISIYSAAGDFPRLALGTIVMCIYVITLNRLIWRPLYLLAETKFQMGK